MAKPPTNEQMLEEDGVRCVSRETDDSWRHGCRVTQVFHREADDTYWQAKYRLSTDGETHGLRDDDEPTYVMQVKPVNVATVHYEGIGEAIDQ